MIKCLNLQNSDENLYFMKWNFLYLLSNSSKWNQHWSNSRKFRIPRRQIYQISSFLGDFWDVKWQHSTIILYEIVLYMHNPQMYFAKILSIYQYISTYIFTYIQKKSRYITTKYFFALHTFESMLPSISCYITFPFHSFNHL